MTLIDDLNDTLGEGHVLTGEDTDGYARDWTGSYAWTPRAVVRPADTEEVAAVLRAAARHGVAVVPVGGNTGLAGGTHAEGALMVSLERLNRIREVRPAARVIVAEAGVVLERLHAAAEEHELSFPLDFGAKGSATVGGFLSTNAGGSNVVRYGNARALTLGIEVVLADGRVMNLMNALYKDNTGYDLRDLFIGAEGTLGIITAAVLRLLPEPRAYATAVVAMDSLGGALRLLHRLQEETGGAVEAFEFMPEAYMARLSRFRPDLGTPFRERHPVNLMIELGATAPRDARPDSEGVNVISARLESVLAEAMAEREVDDAIVASSEAQRRRMWAWREAAAEITLNTHPLVDTDISLPLDRMQAFLDAMDQRLATLAPGVETLVIAHLGDGNFHYTVYPETEEEAHLAAIRAAIAEEAVALGGSFSAEHGIGLSKLPTMAAHKDPVAVEVMRAIKTALDPEGRLNPGKTVP